MRSMIPWLRSTGFVAGLLLSGSAVAGVVTRGDVETLALTATSQPGENGSNPLASEMCGVPVDGLGALPNDREPRATVQSWLPAFPTEGTATVHIVGVGFSQVTKHPTTGPCEGTITFGYRFQWVDTGDNIVGHHENLQSEFTEAPRLVRQQRPGVPGGTPSTPPAASLAVRTDSFCTLRVDGALAGTAQAVVLTTVQVTPGEHLITCGSQQVSGIKASAVAKLTAGQREEVTFSLKALERAARSESTPAPLDAGAAIDSLIDRGGGVLQEVGTGLLWTQRDNGRDITWDGARQYCTGLTTSGGGWRLPSDQEFQDLFDPIRLTGAAPCGDAYCNASRLALTSWWFWIGERKDAALAWTFNFKQGYGSPFAYPVGASAGSRALCVRSPRSGEGDTLQARLKAAEEAAHREPAVEVKEIDRGGGVIEQVSSGLQWTQADNGHDIGWNDARRYCDQLPITGGKWRIPTMDELRNLFWDVVGTKAVPCGTYLCGVPQGFTFTSHWFWSGQSDGPGRGQGLGFDTGYPGTAEVGYSYHARVLCVRHP